jgi:demethylspheroidene O-methyltransferase
MLAMGRGRPRRVSELTVLLRAAGFSRVQVLPTRMPMLTGVLIARSGSR